jgi:hypothetical protein
VEDKGIKWLSVKDELPESGTWGSMRVLVYSPLRGIEIGYLWGNEWRTDSGANITKKITHWACLPPKPEKEDSVMNENLIPGLSVLLPLSAERKLLLKDIAEIKMSMRLSNALRYAGIRCLAEIVIRERSDLLRLKNFERRSLRELEAILSSHNLSLQPYGKGLRMALLRSMGKSGVPETNEL